MRRPEVSDWLRNEHDRLQKAASDACSALKEGAVSLREANDRIRYLERENEDLREKLREARVPA